MINIEVQQPTFVALDTVEPYVRAASYVDRILKGEKPPSASSGGRFEIRSAAGLC
jgi:hypothetical protein